ncbi:hypothetical protein FACS1894219_02840 [Clostridia bacterium]|nr:hypothetical protein FACS1894219_02840 [Clostridia bacterium]
MQFLLSHWHCILPIIGIIAAGFFMREKPKDKGKNEQREINTK